MRKLLLATSALAAAMFSMTSCHKNEDGPTNPVVTDTVMVRGNLVGNQHWVNTKSYMLRGYVYVDGGTLTIDPGTKIYSMNDSAGVLVIYKGAKIDAQGTSSLPIVFTSANATPAPGDLGGLVIVGNASSNGNHSVLEGGVDAAHQAFGGTTGTNDADNSGTLTYVRIEYAGKAVAPSDEVNGLSLYGVGSGTTIDYVEVVRGLDDAFEIFGGTVNLRHTVAYNCADDDYDLDDGYRGHIQYAISVKDPSFTDAKGTTGDLSHNFEVDNGKNVSFDALPRTNPTLSNFTTIGPNTATSSADYGYGMRWRRGAAWTLGNSVVLGGKKGFYNLADTTTISLYWAGTARFTHCIFQSPTDSCVINNFGTLTATPATCMALVRGRDASTFSNDISTVGLNNVSWSATVADNLMPNSGSAPLTTTPDWTGALADGFFEHPTFIGAIGSTDWTSGWTVWK